MRLSSQEEQQHQFCVRKCPITTYSMFMFESSRSLSYYDRSVIIKPTDGGGLGGWRKQTPKTSVRLPFPTYSQCC